MAVSLLSCPLCLKPNFEGVDELRTTLINVATSNIICPVCDEVFLGLDKLTIHLFSHISNNKFVQEVETEEMTNNESQTPIAIAIENRVSKTGDEMEDTETHSKEETLNIVDDIICDICNFHFSDEAILDLHQKLLHQTSPDKKTGKYKYHCHLCSKQFKMRGSLMVHLRVAHFGFVKSNYKSKTECCDFGCSNGDQLNLQNTFEDGKMSQGSDIEPTQIQLDNHNVPNQSTNSKNQDNKQWECDICFKMFTTKYFLKKHKRLHTGEMPYYCSQCNKYFTFQQSYHKHILYHSDEKPHICSECGRAFKELSTLHNHERIHSGERPFCCETCGKCFRQRVSYLVHRRIHTGVMPYKCTACNKSFRYKVSQRSHKCSSNSPGGVIKVSDLQETPIQHQNDKVVVQGKNEVISNATDSANSVQSDILNMSVQENSSLINVSLLPGVHSSKVDKSGTGITTESSQDFFTLLLSPVLSNVQALCLSNYNDVQTINTTQENCILETINEESFKELLYGPLPQ